MTNDQSHHEHAQENGQPMNIAALLRAAADGELSESQCVQLDEYMEKNPEAKSQIEFEHALKSCCKRAIPQTCCPDALRAKISAMAGATHDLGDQQSEDQAFEERIAASNESTRDQSFWSRIGALKPMVGIAAVIMLMIAGTLIWQSTSFNSANYYAPPGLSVKQANYYNRVGNFALDEHQRCCKERVAKAKLIRHDMDEAISYFSEKFSVPVSMPELTIDESSVEFYGGGDCSVPSTSKSGHLRFDAIGPDNQRVRLSLFISPDPSLLPMEEGVTYQLTSKACDEAGARLYAWTLDGVQYILVSEATNDLCSSVRTMLQAPTLTQEM